VVPTAISVTVMIRTRLRPMRSPSAPKMIPPNGRTANAAAKVPNVAIRPTALELSLG